MTPHARRRTPLARISELLLVALVFLLPLETRWIAIQGTLNGDPWEYGTISLYGIDLLIGLFILCAGVHIVLERKKFRPSLTQLLGLLLAVIAFFSIAFATNNISALYWWGRLAEGVALLWVIPSLHIRRWLIVGALLVSGVIQSFMAYLQFVAQKVLAIKWIGMAAQNPADLGVQVIETGSERILRAYAGFPHPNMLGGFLVVVLLVGVVFYAIQPKKWHQILTAVALALCSTGLWLSFSRQAMLALGVSLIAITIVTFVTEKRFPKQLAVGIAFIVIPMIVFTAAFPQLIRTRVAGNTRLEVQSTEQRKSYVDQSVDLLREKWVTGVGIGNYTAFLHKKDKTNEVQQPGFSYQPVHTVALLIFCELGVFGIIGFLFFVLSLGMDTIRSRKYSLGWGAAVLALLVISLFDHYLWSLQFGILLFWTTVALFDHSKR